MTTASVTAATEQPVQGTTHDGEQVMGLLEEHVPLSLIMDLSEPAGPDSRAILQTEGAPEATWWVQP